MKTSHSVAIAVLAAVCATGAQAQVQANDSPVNGYYAEVGYSHIDISGAGNRAKPDTLRLIVGNELHENLGVEIMYLTTISKDKRVGYEGSIASLGVFLKPKITVFNGTELFARAGVMRSDINAAISGSSNSNDFAYGVGIQTNFSKVIYGQLDYMQLHKRNNVSAKGFAVSLGARF